MWQTIISNPAFQRSPYAGMNEDWFNRLSPEVQQHLFSQFGPTEDVNGMSRVTPALATPSGPDAPPTADTNSNTALNEFVPVTINEGTPSQYVVEYNPATGAVRALDGNPTSMMMVGANEAQQQRLAQDAYNLTLQRPVLEAARQNQTAEGILSASAATGQPSGAAVEGALNSRQDLASAQATAAANTSRPAETSVVLSRQTPATTPAYTGLEQFEIDNPYTAPVLTQAQPQPVTDTTQPALTQPTDYIGNHMDRNMAQAAQPTDYVGNHMDRNMAQAMPVLTNPSQPATSQPVLANTNAAPATTAAPVAAAAPAAAGGASVRTGAGRVGASTAPMTSNARGSDIPNLLVGRGEGLIRIGGAMYSGALQGDGIGAATREYGQIQDANRTREMERFKIEEARRVEQARLRAAAARAGGRGRGRGAGTTSLANQPYAQATMRAIQTIRGLVNAESDWNPFDNTTGFTGNFLSTIPGTPAHEVSQAINTIEAAIGFDRLQAMRDASPTGGALGQVSEMELRLLSQSLGSLRQSQGREQFLENLAAVEEHYQRTLDAIAAQQEAYNRGVGQPAAGGTTTPSQTTLSQSDLDYMNN